MPYAIRRNHDKSYSVINTESRKVHSYHTTKEKATAQLRLLFGLDHGMILRKK